MSALEQYAGNWAKIAEVLKSKSKEDVKDRVKLLNETEVKECWTPEDDKLIADMVKKIGRSWALIAKKVPGRTNKEVRERYVKVIEKKQ